ncbi:MAG: GTP 3',8-cyclase MoaA [Opitutae bacterium]|nr:GTP 3',8-cyclase MoaA [Opitutae bacterium]
MSLPRDILNRPIGDLRISVTDRCNLRCSYCMPAEIFGVNYPFLPDRKILRFDEIERLCRLFVRCGARKVRLTGGEPLLRPNLTELVGKLAKIDDLLDLALTTNGLGLREHASSLRKAGLQRVTVSLDALSDDLVRKLGGGGSVEKVLDGIAAAKEAGLEVKVNSVILRGLNDGEILPLAKRFRGGGVVLRFIEFMDVGNHNGWQEDSVVTSREVLDILGKEFGFEEVAPSYVGEVAKRYRYLDGGGEFGLVSSVSHPFCGDCSRARLTADGKLVTCLFAKDGHDLLASMRGGASDADLLRTIKGVWVARKDRYSEQRADGTKRSAKAKVEMSYVGG